MSDYTKKLGRLRKAPENFLSAEQIAQVQGGRRDFLRKAFLTASATMAAGGAANVYAADRKDWEGDKGSKFILKEQEWRTTLGAPVNEPPYGMPSKYEKDLVRRISPGLAAVNQANVAFAPLQGMFGIVTPAGLHFNRSHQGWYDINPEDFRFMVMGEKNLIKKPKVYTVGDIMRMQPVSRFHFIECGANSAMEWGNVALPTVQYTHGMVSCSEFTGVPLIDILEDCGADLKGVRFIMAEGADGSTENRTIPMSLVLSGEVLVAYGQNGEMLRPENGYPLRLVVPGVEGVSNIKYLRRIKLGTQPFATKDETVGYVDLMPDGRLRQYTSVMEVKSVITSPSGGQVLLDKGLYNVSGLAWSGRGKIKRVDVSFDGGVNWQPARLEGPIQSKAFTRFNVPWIWKGQVAFLQSRAIDETGMVQPTYEELRKVRGTRSVYHNNAIQTWQVEENGDVRNVQLANS
ncbi:MAG TPA: sulfite dehydrogenase [Thiomonas arsenitoxydans]|jgi:sulfane dehydrogenase subunit SoxC|uniref:Oxidoreductase molybdopterin binding protein n=1 Tax=Thiomonas intermedia (strain K12) TaxID=75379 RepID=D5X462_THIK1|nr:sulfite dehydrogenase [Thiomonas sp.]OZB76642.1 MAG: sulfite dehydrogenase [Thiomonas sp. 14-64-326]HOI65832.1 sulfite dehydrogenase [Thiomonas arsenitoxydans]